MFELLVNNHLTCLTCHFFLWKKNYRFILAKKPFAISQWHVTSLTISREEQCALPSLKTVASAHGTVAHHTTQSHCFNQSVAFGRGGKKMSGFCGLLAWRGNNWKNACGISSVFDLSLPTFFLYVAASKCLKRVREVRPWPLISTTQEVLNATNLTHFHSGYSIGFKF